MEDRDNKRAHRVSGAQLGGQGKWSHRRQGAQYVTVPLQSAFTFTLSCFDIWINLIRYSSLLPQFASSAVSCRFTAYLPFLWIIKKPFIGWQLLTKTQLAATVEWRFNDRKMLLNVIQKKTCMQNMVGVCAVRPKTMAIICRRPLRPPSKQ